MSLLFSNQLSKKGFHSGGVVKKMGPGFFLGILKKFALNFCLLLLPIFHLPFSFQSLTCLSSSLYAYFFFLPSIMDKSVDTFEQNKCFLSTSLRKFKKHVFCLWLNPLSPFSMLKNASLTLPRGNNIEKGRGGRKVKI